MGSKVIIFLCLSVIITLISPVLAGTGNCKFEHTSNYHSDLISDHIYGYMCTLNLDIQGDRVNTIRGNHQRGNRDNNVDIIKISSDYQSFLTSFPRTICSRLTKLEIIDMCEAEIATIEADSLEKCKDLKILQFYRNKIEELPENLLAENKKLQKLFITFNSVKNLPQNFLEGLTLLTILDLSYNKIDHLHSSVFDDLDSVFEMHLEGNKLKELNHNLFRNVQKLENLNLNSNEISELPRGLFSSLTSLKSLFLQYNKLTTVHADSFPQLAQINIVSFSNNKIDTIDEAFINNCRVSNLKMAGNVCARDTNIRSHQMKQKLQNCYNNYRNSYITTSRHTTRRRSYRTAEPITTQPLPTSFRPTSNKLIPWIEGCGRAQVGTQTIIGGTKVNKGTHPWIAALMDKNKGYFCGGTLITKRLVVTAAHCILGKQSEMNPEDLTVILGAHKLDDSNDIGKRTYGVESIHPHDHWNPRAVKFDADIAVLRLSENVIFDMYIQPVCLAKIGVNLKNYADGIVVGFGKFDKSETHSNIPMKANTPIRDSDDCYLEFPSLLNIASRRTFCGGFANGTGVCTGDSGGGLTVVENEVHYLRGIVSASLHGADYGCDVDSYSIFTDMKHYLNFIRPFNY